jgi:hypothetical protein
MAKIYKSEEAATGKYYKREVSLMNKSIFPRSALDKPIDNPDVENSTVASFVGKSDQEIVNNVVSALRKTGTK